MLNRVWEGVLKEGVCKGALLLYCLIVYNEHLSAENQRNKESRQAGAGTSGSFMFRDVFIFRTSCSSRQARLLAPPKRPNDEVPFRADFLFFRSGLKNAMNTGIYAQD